MKTTTNRVLHVVYRALALNLKYIVQTIHAGNSHLPAEKGWMRPKMLAVLYTYSLIPRVACGCYTGRQVELSLVRYHISTHANPRGKQVVCDITGTNTDHFRSCHALQ